MGVGCGGDPALGSFGRFPAASLLRRAGRVDGWVLTCVHMGWGERKRGFGVLGGLGLESFVWVWVGWPGLVGLGLSCWGWLMGLVLGLGFVFQGLVWAGFGWADGAKLGGACLGLGCLVWWVV